MGIKIRKCDYFILGAGPAGISAGLMLANHGADVVIADKGLSISKRICPIDTGVAKECKCVTCAKLHGFMGAGGKSDGKLIFSPYNGGNLYDLGSRKTVDRSIDRSEKLFKAICDPIYSKKVDKTWLINECAKNGFTMRDRKEAHIGSDKLYTAGDKLYKIAEESGIKFFLGHSLHSYTMNLGRSGGWTIVIKDVNGYKTFECNKFIMAVGRSGFNWIQESINSFVDAKYKPLDIGFRVETLNRITKPITDIQYDFKLESRYKDFKVRSYCVNPGGYVTIERHDEFCLPNGHSLALNKSDNCNFAILFSAELVEPCTNSSQYGKNIAKVYSDLGGGFPVVQRLEDFYRGRRTTLNRLSRSNVKATLSSCTPGDHTWAMPGIIIDAVLDYINRLDKIIPGLSNGYNTLLYGPEIKFQALDLDLDKNFRSKKKHLENSPLYFIGDCSGKTGGIISASAMGFMFAERQLNDN